MERASPGCGIPLRILFDAYWWHRGPRANRMVLQQTVTEWVRRYPQDEVILAVPRGVPNAIQVPTPGRVVTTKAKRHPVINRLELPGLARREGVDAVLAQNFAIRHPRSGVYLYDTIFQSNPEFFTWIERHYFALMPRYARDAAVVFTGTHSERRRILRHNPQLGRVVVTGLAPSSEMLNSVPRAPELGLVPRRFMLTVGRINVRKNMARTIAAALRSGVVSPDCPLVVVGARSGRVARLGEAASAVEAGLVRLVGSVSDPEMHWLYENCRLFLGLSLAEGFGLPPCEATSFGAPVLVSDLEVFRETLGRGASFVDPTDLEAIASMIRSMTCDPNVADRAERPFASPSWSDMVDVVRGEFQKMLNAT